MLQQLRAAVEPLTTAVSLAAVTAIIPSLDEAEAIGQVVRDVLAQGVGRVIVVDGASRDATAETAAGAGADVIVEPRRGYGRAMMTGLAALGAECTVVLFFDGDGSDDPGRIADIAGPVLAGQADFVLGSRLRGAREKGSLNASQIVAGHLAGLLIRLRYGVRFTDMSPFRAISRTALDGLGMREESFGWNLEMQMRVAASGLRIVELPVGQRRRRGGASKVSGDLIVSARVAWVLLRTFLRIAGAVRRTSGRAGPAPPRP
jgi:glycosyltransferase involved in cell wall biosynthesis